MKFSTLKRTEMTKNKAGKFYKPAFFTLDNFIIFKIFHVKHSSIKSSKLQIIKLSIPQSMTHLKFCLWNFPVFLMCVSSIVNFIAMALSEALQLKSNLHKRKVQQNYKTYLRIFLSLCFSFALGASGLHFWELYCSQSRGVCGVQRWGRQQTAVIVLGNLQGSGQCKSGTFR